MAARDDAECVRIDESSAAGPAEHVLELVVLAARDDAECVRIDESSAAGPRFAIPTLLAVLPSRSKMPAADLGATVGWIKLLVGDASSCVRLLSLRNSSRSSKRSSPRENSLR